VVHPLNVCSGHCFQVEKKILLDLRMASTGWGPENNVIIISSLKVSFTDKQNLFTFKVFLNTVQSLNTVQ